LKHAIKPERVSGFTCPVIACIQQVQLVIGEAAAVFREGLCMFFEAEAGYFAGADYSFVKVI